jgi:copper resistance protein D
MSVTLFVVRAVYFAAALQLFGTLIFSVWFAPLRRHWIWIPAALALLTMLLWLPIETAAMSGEESTLGMIGIALRETRFGELWILRVVFLAVLCAIVRWRYAAAFFAGAVLVLTAASGHGGADDNLFHLAADAIHLLAAGAWLGGLLPFVTAIKRGDMDVARRFSTLGAICVGLILLTGGVNAWFLVGSFRALTGSEYGRLLIVKLALFAILVSVAAVNRYRLVPRGDAVALRRNALIETALGIAIVIIVAVLGTMPPGYYLSPR